MSHSITATEAARNFSDLLNRVRYQGETFDIVRGGEVVARISSASPHRRARAAELISALRGVEEVDPSFTSDLETIQRGQPSLPDDPWAF